MPTGFDQLLTAEELDAVADPDSPVELMIDPKELARWSGLRLPCRVVRDLHRPQPQLIAALAELLKRADEGGLRRRGWPK